LDVTNKQIHTDHATSLTADRIYKAVTENAGPEMEDEDWSKTGTENEEPNVGLERAFFCVVY